MFFVVVVAYFTCCLFLTLEKKLTTQNPSLCLKNEKKETINKIYSEFKLYQHLSIEIIKNS